MNQCHIASLPGITGDKPAVRLNAAMTGAGRNRHAWMGLYALMSTPL